MGFLQFGYAYALIGLEINIRLDSISNVCIIIPDKLQSGRVSQVRNFLRCQIGAKTAKHDNILFMPVGLGNTMAKSLQGQ